MKEIENYLNKEAMNRRKGKKEIPDKEYYKMLLLKGIYDKLNNQGIKTVSGDINIEL